jgi:hypothetical protein
MKNFFVIRAKKESLLAETTLEQSFHKNALHLAVMSICSCSALIEPVLVVVSHTEY